MVAIDIFFLGEQVSLNIVFQNAYVTQVRRFMALRSKFDHHGFRKTAPDHFSFEPTIVEDLGYTGTRAQLMSAPPFAVAFVCE